MQLAIPLFIIQSNLLYNITKFIEQPFIELYSIRNNVIMKFVAQKRVSSFPSSLKGYTSKCHLISNTKWMDR